MDKDDRIKQLESINECYGRIIGNIIQFSNEQCNVCKWSLKYEKEKCPITCANKELLGILKGDKCNEN